MEDFLRLQSCHSIYLFFVLVISIKILLFVVKKIVAWYVEFPILPEMFDDIAQGEQELDPVDFPEVVPLEVPLLVNASDLPVSLEKLEIHSLGMFTTDLKYIFRNRTNLTTHFLKDSGKSGALGVTGRLIYSIAELEKLKFLEIIIIGIFHPLYNCINDERCFFI
jgi:hypothetical protein